MNKKIFLIAFIVASCATSTFQEGYFISKDDFKEIEYQHYGIKYANYATGEGTYFDFYTAIKKDNKKTYFLEVVANKADWHFIEKIEFKINGEIYNFDEINNKRDVLSGSSVLETITFLLNEDLLNKFLNTDLIEVRLSGKYIIDEKIISTELIGLQNYFKKEL